MMCIFQVLRRPQDLLLELERCCCDVRPKSQIKIKSLGVNFISLLQGCRHFSHILEKFCQITIASGSTCFLSLLTESDDAGNHVATFSNGG